MKVEKTFIGFLLFVAAYPVAHYLVAFIPNPIIPNANIAINMIFPVLAGYFYGPMYGLMAGAIGTGLSGIIYADIYDALAIFPHAVMGYLAGLAGNERQFLSAISVLAGHVLNVFFFWRFNLLVIDNPLLLLLGLITETTIDVVAIIFFIIVLQKIPYFKSYK